MASTMDVAKRLVELCKQNKNLQAVEELYADDIVSIDAHGDEKMPARMEGKQKIIGKNKWFFENHDVHKQDAEGPWPNADKFVVVFSIDLTAKTGPMAGKRFQMKEAALYTVKNGKIVHEEFYYDMG